VKARVTDADSLLDALRAWAARHPYALKRVEGPRWAVAFSAGADSTALLWAAHTLWPGRVVALHVHHGLQDAADGFEAHARHLCGQWRVDLRVTHLNARAKPGESPEDAARRARYAALADLARSADADGVLLGQHANDQLETMVLALSRGAGLPGLAAMPDLFERHGMRFGRPFLALPGTVLRSAMTQQGVAFVEDPTNSDPRYTRNRIRANVLPGLLAAFPNALSTFARSARHAAQGQALLQELAQDDLRLVGNPPIIRHLRVLSRPRQSNLLRHWLKEGWGAVPSDSQLQEVLNQLAACSTRGHRIQLKVAEGRLTREGDRLHYAPCTPPGAVGPFV
jgi:tRNA(Ile)-lysidine synthase